jgi:hypothetical protein
MAGDPGNYVVSRAEELRGGPLSPALHRRAVTASYWLYGLAWAGGLAVLAPRLRMHRLGTALGAGAGLGVLTWAVGYLAWLPATGLVKPVTRERPSKTAMGLAQHVLFGLLAALPIHIVERQFRRERIATRLYDRWALKRRLGPRWV